MYIIIWAFSLICCVQHAFSIFPYITPTVGRPWPLPQQEMPSYGFMLMDINNFSFKSMDNDCQILQNAYSRYLDILKKASMITKQSNKLSNYINTFRDIPGDYFTTLEVTLLEPCETYPHLNMEEQYELKICGKDNPTSVKLISSSVWGVLRGLETFSQLAIRSSSVFTFRFNCTQILDYPRFPHRGILLDSARHYLPMWIIKQNLDLMAMNKFNVFHWHIVDSQSFPYQSDVFPRLSAMGAWSDIHVYTKENIAEIVEYARNLGIRVVAEFDTPGHTDAWGVGQPGFLTECYIDGIPDGSFGPVDPSNEDNYLFLESLFTEISTRFPDHYIHLGGDEVLFRCWKSNANITKFMENHNITGYRKLEEYYITRLIEIVSRLPNGNGYTVWEEVFDNGVVLSKDAIVHVWMYGGRPHEYYSEMANVTSAGYQTILSSCWYLNYISYGEDWYKYYECDPQAFDGTDEQKKLVLGGEACMWGEMVDETNLTPRLWPRAAAVAERLWSSEEVTSESSVAEPRMEEHRCRLLSRGYPAQPLKPSFCEGVL